MALRGVGDPPKNLDSVLIILVLFELFSGKFCLNNFAPISIVWTEAKFLTEANVIAMVVAHRNELSVQPP